MSTFKGKGSNRRPSTISEDNFSDNWNAIFKKNDNISASCDSNTPSDGVIYTNETVTPSESTT